MLSGVSNAPEPSPSSAGTDGPIGQVGVVILQYGASALDGSLLSLVSDPVVGAVVVVRNPRVRADDDEALPDDRISLVVAAENGGYSKAANAGRRHERIRDLPLHLVLTHDVALRPGCVARLAEAMLLDPSVAVAGPVLLEDTSGSRTGRFGGDFGRFGLVRHRSLPLTSAARIDEVDWIDGAVMLLRSSVAGFDERFFLYGEDVAVCLSVRPERRVVVVTDAVAQQVSGAAKRPGAHGYLLVRNALLLDTSRQVGRVDGVVRCIVMLGAQMKRAVVGSDPGRGYHMKQLLGMAWGVVDGLRGVGGPPPARLRKWGDVETSTP
jgi:GT2 family glycosyltransferase